MPDPRRSRQSAVVTAARIVLLQDMEVHMIPIKNILVATDFSEPSVAALDYGREFAKTHGATLHVVHVIEDLLAFQGADIGFAITDVARNIEAAALQDLDAAVSADDRAELPVRTVPLRSPSVPHAITDYASRNAIDLIVVGTHGRGAIHRFLIGSVAERVMRTAPCPVLTVRRYERDAIGDDVHHVADAAPAGAAQV
jgi:nucleotide-binding universal stress UspA family protein